MSLSIFTSLLKGLGGLLLSILLTTVAPTIATASPSLVPSEMKTLPASVQQWWIYEIYHTSQEADLRYIPVIGENNQDPRYRPEARRVFEITAYWLPLESVETFQSKVPDELQKLTLRKNSKTGRSEVLFFVHPESTALYPDIANNSSLDHEIFKAIPSASSRGLLVWKKGSEKFPFIAKVSLDREISGSLRVIPAIETQLSIEASKILESTKTQERVSYMHEVLSVIPKGMNAGGQIFRVFSPAMLEGRVTSAPLFALYGGSEKVAAGSLLKNLIEKSGLEPVEYVRTQIIRPFVKIWLEFAIRGISMEPHAQNVLAVIADGKLQHFEFRDFGGFDFDREFRKQKNLSVPAGPLNKHFADPGDFTVDHGKYMFKSLQRYFSAGFLYGIENQFFNWRREKIFRLKNIKAKWTREILVEELSLELSRIAGKQIKVREDLTDIATKVKAARELPTKNQNPSCRRVF